jgi:hypothetical protein
MMQLVARATTQAVQSMIDGLAAFDLDFRKGGGWDMVTRPTDPIDQNLEWRQGIGG